MKISFGALAAFVVVASPAAAQVVRLGAPTTTDAAATTTGVYDIGVAAIHEPVAVVPDCDFAQAQDRLQESFGLHDTTSKDGRRLDPRYDCNRYCPLNGFSPPVCFWYSQGECGHGRKMTEVEDDVVPPSVAEECLRRKKIVGLALQEEAAAAASLSTECHDYFASGWEFKCVYHVEEE